MSALISIFVPVYNLEDYLPECLESIAAQTYQILSVSSSTMALPISPSSSILALSSRYEGFGLVILEAMACGLPVVSYACPCGPKDIITDGIDGFLVPDGDEIILAERICRLIEDEELRKRMGAAVFERTKDFTLDKNIPDGVV